ncbi:hypothetical protein SAMD00019534_012640, partial [Acytostelium subglobosum LB1]|uniref:hypothetical protein n=1 Tax=Acytostelium subglobosum LB1 TaxID=1410327 RepID=UPI00064488BC
KKQNKTKQIIISISRVDDQTTIKVNNINNKQPCLVFSQSVSRTQESRIAPHTRTPFAIIRHPRQLRQSHI